MTRARRRSIVAIVTGLLATAACDGAFESQAWNGRRLATPVSKPTVEWERTDGTRYRMSEATAGRVTLLYFGYTHCPDVCPTQLAHLATALRRLGADSASRIDVLVVSVDPARDSARVLADWVQGFDPRFIGLRGDAAVVQAEIARLGLAPSAADLARATDDPPHAAAVLAFARDGRGHFVYPPTTSPEAWLYDLRKLLRDSVP